MGQLRSRSIAQLCSLDHHDDPHSIHEWAGDGSAEKFLRLLDQADVSLLVAERDGRIVSIGGLRGDLVTLNYVDPDYRFMGFSKAMMTELEARMVSAGVKTGRVNSTTTALPFYRAIGWHEAGPASPEDGHPMIKEF